MIDWDTLIPVSNEQLAGAITGLIANPVVGTGLLLTMAAVLGPRVVRFVFRAFGRG